MFVQGGNELRLFDGSAIPHTSKMITTGGMRGGDFGYTSDGALVFLFNHNSQWTTVANDYRYTGSIQWGALPNPGTYTFTADRDEAFNWSLGLGNNDTSSTADVFPRLGLGNMSFLNNPTGYSYNAFDLNRYSNLRMITIGSSAISRNFVMYYDVNSESRGLASYTFKAGTNVDLVSNTGSRYWRRTNATAVRENNIVLGSNWYATLDKYQVISGINTVSLGGTQTNNNTGLSSPRGRLELAGDSYTKVVGALSAAGTTTSATIPQIVGSSVVPGDMIRFTLSGNDNHKLVRELTIQ